MSAKKEHQKDSYHHAIPKSGLNRVHDVLEYKRWLALVCKPSRGSTWVGVPVNNESAVDTLDIYGNMLRGSTY
jgi:hypothetical protein